jgi:SulP family sulfate permease
MRHMLNVDTTGLEILDALQRKLARNGKQLFIAAAADQALSLFRRSGFSERLGGDRFTADVEGALAQVREV